MECFVAMLCNSDLSVGYLGLTDYLLPLYEDFFSQELLSPIQDSSRSDLKPKVIDQLAKITQILTESDKAEKVIPIILENIKDDQDEDKRI